MRLCPVFADPVTYVNCSIVNVVYFAGPNGLVYLQQTNNIGHVVFRTASILRYLLYILHDNSFLCQWLSFSPWFVCIFMANFRIQCLCKCILPYLKSLVFPKTDLLVDIMALSTKVVAK